MLITSFWLTDILIFLISIVFLTCTYSTWAHGYWKRKGVPYLKPIPLFGNAFDLFSLRKNSALWTKDMYNSIDEPFFGIYVFNTPLLMLKSPELIKHVLIKDFNFFKDRTVLAAKHDEIMSNVMFMQKNPDWRKVRTLMTPVFTSGKLKGMFPLINNVAIEMNKYISENLGQIEAKDLCGNYAIDVIAKCAFAIHAYSFNREDACFKSIGKRFFGFSWKLAINQVAYFFFQNWADRLQLEFFDRSGLQTLSDIFWQAIKTREETNVKGNDLIDIIIDMRKNKELCNEINFRGDRVVAQAVMFFVAGFETTSTTISFTLYELCVNPKIQDRLREEIISSIREHNGVTYDSIHSMKYLEMCILETLRKYNSVPVLDRRCDVDYKIPGTDIIIEKGTSVLIPTWGLSYDEKYFPRPEDYNPDRFSDKASYNVNGLYYLPFGEGPRNCIGARFGMISTKVALINILSKFIVEKSSLTPSHIEFTSKSFTAQSRGGLHLKFKEIHPKAA